MEKKPLINIDKRMFSILVVVGVLFGVTHAWHAANKEAGLASSLARIETAAGTEAGAAHSDNFAVQNDVKIGGAFTLVDHNGETVTEKNYAGSHKLIFFGFTHCPGICPVELQKMAIALDSMGELAENIQPIFITTDPERDTPEVMKSYVELYHPRLVGLTGTAEQVKDVEKSYRVYAAKQEIAGQEGYQINHTAYMYLTGPDNELVTVFSKEDTPDDLAAELTKILQQS